MSTRVHWSSPYRVLTCLVLATVALTLTACGGGSSGSTPTPFVPANLPSPAHDGPVIILSGKDNKFDKESISAEANNDLSIVFVNNDAAPHNVAIYTNENAEEEVYVGETFTGPGEYQDYTFEAPAEGDYFFRCDVHPTTMTGEFNVD